MHAVLHRYRIPGLRGLDRATGTIIRKTARRYGHPAPGDLVHVVIKKLGNIPDGGGHRVLDRVKGHRRHGMGYAYLHNAVDDHSRLAYTEIHADEQGVTAAGFWTRAQAYFTGCGITVAGVLTDNGACYRSRLWRDTLADQGIVHKRTRPYQCESDRRADLPAWLHFDNHHRGHTGIGGHPPASRVPNLSGQNNQ